MNKGECSGNTPFRRDWLNRAFGADRGLWLARLLSDYAPADLAEGDEVILRDIGEDDLQERQLILWRVHGRLAIGRFSATIRPTEPNGEYWVPPVLIGDQEEDMTPVARILGRRHPVLAIRSVNGEAAVQLSTVGLRLQTERPCFASGAGSDVGMKPPVRRSAPGIRRVQTPRPSQISGSCPNRSSAIPRPRSRRPGFCGARAARV